MNLINAASDPDVSAGIGLGTELVAGLLLVVLMVLIHGAGVVGATKLLRLEDRTLRAHRLNVKAFRLLTSIALCLFGLHLFEITVFAIFYLGVGALQNLETALYFSASAYSTLGHPDLNFPDEWRLVGAVEGLVGFLLIGWSTAVFITDMNKVLREEA
jgi:hypothetical protein